MALNRRLWPLRMLGMFACWVNATILCLVIFRSDAEVTADLLGVILLGLWVLGTFSAAILTWIDTPNDTPKKETP